MATRLAPFAPALPLLGLVVAFEHPDRAAGDVLSVAALAVAMPLAVASASKAIAGALAFHTGFTALPNSLAPGRHPWVALACLASLLAFAGWTQPAWVLVALVPFVLVPAGMLLGGALDALAVHAARRVGDPGTSLAVILAVVAGGFGLTLTAGMAGQALAPRFPAAVVLGLVALSWGAATGTAIAAGVLVAALAGRGVRQAASRAVRVLVFSTTAAALLGYMAGAVGPGMLSPSGVPHVPALVLVLLAASVVIPPGTADVGSGTTRPVVPPKALSHLLVSTTAGVVSLVLLAERLGGFPRTPLAAAVTAAALLAGGAAAVVLRGGPTPTGPLPSPPLVVRSSGAPARGVLVAGLVLLLLLYEAPRRELDLVSRAGTALGWAVFVGAVWRVAGAFEPLASRLSLVGRRACFLRGLAWTAAGFYLVYFPVQDYLLGVLGAGGHPWQGLGPSLASLSFLVLGPAFFAAYLVVTAALLAVFAAAGMLMARFLGDLVEATLPPRERWRHPWPSSPWAVLAPAAALVSAALALPGELPENRYGWGLGVALLGLAVAVSLLAVATLRSREDPGHLARRVARDLAWAVLLGWFIGYTMGEAREIETEGTVPFVALLMAGLKFFEIVLETPERITRAGLAASALPDLLIAVVAALLLLTFIQTVAPAAAVISIKEVERIGLMAGAVLLPLVRARSRRAATLASGEHGAI